MGWKLKKQWLKMKWKNCDKPLLHVKLSLLMIPDKKCENELQDRIAKYKEKLATREEVITKKESLENEIRELLEKIYAEAT